MPAGPPAFATSAAAPNLYESLFEHSADGILITTQAGDILRANPAACRLLGRSEGELRRLGRADLLVDEPQLHRMVAQRNHERGVSTAELHFRRGDGTTFAADVTTALLPGTGDEVLAYAMFRDLTPARQAAEATRAAKRLTQSTLDAMAAQVCVLDGTGNILAVNEAWRAFSAANGGPPATTLLGSNYVDVCQRASGPRSEEAALFFERLREVLAGARTSFHLEYPCHSPVAQRWFIARVSRYAEEGLVRVVVAHEDVSELKRAGSELQAVLDYNQRLVAAAPIGIWAYRAGSGQCVLANPAAEKMAGATGARLLEQNFRQIESWQRDGLLAAAEVALATGAEQRLPIHWRTSFGREIWGQAVLTTFTSAGGLHLLLIVSDLTEERRAQSSARLLAAAVEQTPASVVITDAKGTIEYVNPAFEAAAGYSFHEALGQNPRILKSGTQSEEVYRDLWTTISAGRNWQGRLVNKSKSGRLFTEDAVISPVRDERGAVVSFVAVKRDITEELALQQRLADSERLKSIGRLAGGIAHDFNNILAVILADVEDLADPAGLPPMQVTELAREIGDAAGRARDLTRQLLAFARQQIIAPVPLDLNASLTKSERLLRRLLGEDVELVVRFEPGLWPVLCDPSQLEQVVLNLTANARDAMTSGGRLTLETSRLAEGDPAAGAYPGLSPGDYVQLSVTDTGCGMAPEVLARLFEPFFTTKRLGQGTGLGLATVHGIVKQSGGYIRCESRPGAGTTFHLCLPRAKAQPAGHAPAAPAARSPRGTETILLVEDDADVRRISIRALEAAGFRVRIARDGLAALELASRAPDELHLVVTDVVMPGLNGGALVEELRVRQPALRALFVSGYTDDAISQRGVLPEGVEFLPKPFTGSELVARVRRLLDGG
jgi:PAS domain S-box-containing protein